MNVPPPPAPTCSPNHQTESCCRVQPCFSPEVGVVAADGDRLRHAERVPEDKLHVVGGAQAGEEQVLCSDGPAQHVGDALCLGTLGNAGDLMDASWGRRLLGRELPSRKQSQTSEDIYWHPKYEANQSVK